MADNSILTPGYQDPINDPVVTPEPNKYLEKDNYLSEYSTEEEKSVVRENLNIPSKDSVYSKEDVDTQVSTKIRDAILEYLNMEDPYGIIPLVEEMIAYMVKTDGSTPFTAPQTGVDPQTDLHLATKKYVDRLMKDHLGTEDPHGILLEVATLLLQYVKSSEVYNKSQLYTKQDIDNQSKLYIKKDGTTPFTKALIGADPLIDSHLATKRYVDKVLYNHKVEPDPHNFLTLLNLRLAAYSKKKDVYDKTQTYSRTLIDSIINKLVNLAVESSIQDYQESVDDKLEYIRKQNYVKADGSIPFKNPLYGVPATDKLLLVTLGLVLELLSTLSNKIDNKECTWKTSGPVEATVGMVEENTEFPDEVTLQEILDAIFYGKSVSIDVPDYTTITETCPILLCIHGSLSLIINIEVYQGNTLIYTLSKEDFEGGCITVDSLPILLDTEFVFRVTYSNGAVHEDSDVTKVSMPVFVGLLPKWKFANTITMEYLKELEALDIDGTLNRFLTYGNDLESITFNYVFLDAELRHPFIVIPETYPDLKSLVTESQSFGIEAFDVIDMIPLHIKGVEEDVIYKIYVYRLALSSMNQSVTFNFNNQ